jgi:arylsulfatase A-like enzyme
VLLIVVDTLRADRLGIHGSELGLTPRVDALAAESRRFERAYAHAPWTLPSFASLFTSLYPPQHGAGGRVPDFRGLREPIRTVAECFRDAGYATAAVVNVDFLTEKFGTMQGFAHVDFEVHPNNVETRVAEKTTDAALAWLRQPRAGPFFLLVHYFDPHLVYAPPASYRAKFAAPQDREDASWVFGTRQQIVQYRQGMIRFDEPTIRRAEQLYNGEVAYTDHEVGRLLDAVGTMQLSDSTIVVFTSDHGEEFFDHGGFEHGHTLYEELVHVPLMIRYPGKVAAGSESDLVGLVDVAPTLCALAGVEGDPAFVGRDLLGSTESEQADERPIILQGNFWGPPHRGWIQGGHKLIVEPERRKLFDLRADPGEQRELSASEPELLRKTLEDMQLAFKAMAAHLPRESAPVELSEEERERLRVLGYLEP